MNRPATAEELQALSEAGRPRPQAFHDLASFIGAYEPLSYFVEGVVRSGSLYTLTGKTGHGKTGLLCSAAFGVADGKPEIIGRDVVPARVAYLAVENADDIRMRLAITAYRFNIDVEKLASRIMVLDRRMKPEEIAAELIKLSEPEPFGLIIVDTLAALFDGKDINDAVQGGEFMRRLRPLTKLPGLPSAIVAAHPVKGASADQLVPYGSGAILNEVDGNLTLWKSRGIASLHWQGKLRGLDFDPLAFKFDACGSPDLLDAKGRQVTIPVCVPTTEDAVDEREAAVGARNMIVLRAIANSPRATQRQLMDETGISSGSFTRTLKTLEAGRFIEKCADDRYRPTSKGEKELA